MSLRRPATILVLLASALLALAIPSISHATTDEMSRPELLKLAGSDHLVDEYLALQDGPFEVTVEPGDLRTAFTMGGDPTHHFKEVHWTHEGSAPVVVIIDTDTRRIVNSAGEGVMVMPSAPDSVSIASGNGLPWILIPLAVMFLLCLVFGPTDRYYRLWIAVPIGVTGICFMLMMLNLLDAETLRYGTLVLYALPLISLTVAACVWLSPRVRRTATEAIMPLRLSAVMVVTSLAIQMALVLRSDKHVDIAVATTSGARKMVQGITVYGNIPMLPGTVVWGDTYGPLAYMAHAPFALVGEGITWVALVANVVFCAITASLLYIAERKRSGTRSAMWMAALWTSCPFVVLGDVLGHNDVLVGMSLAILALVWQRPVWRGVATAAAASTKLLPFALIFGQLRHRGEPRGTSWRVVGGFVGALVLIWTIGLHDLRGARAFADGFQFQLDRFPTNSVWGLARIDGAQNLWLVAAAFAAIWSWRLAVVHGQVGALRGAAATLTFLLLSRQHYSATYFMWILPLLLLSLTRFTEPDPAEDEVQIGDDDTIPTDMPKAKLTARG